jgi:hypothetical protein
MASVLRCRVPINQFIYVHDVDGFDVILGHESFPGVLSDNSVVGQPRLVFSLILVHRRAGVRSEYTVRLNTAEHHLCGGYRRSRESLA